MPNNKDIDQLPALDEVENFTSNPSGNRPFEDIAWATLSRRTLLKGSLAAATTAFLSPAMASGSREHQDSTQSLINFTPLSIKQVNEAEGKAVTISPDYQYQAFIPWGTPINPNSGIAEYKGDPNTRPTAEEAEQQIGLGHDGMWFFPLNQAKAVHSEMKAYRRLHNKPKFNPLLKRLVGRTALHSHIGVLCLNHEHATNIHALGKKAPESLEDVRLSQAVHGVSVIAIRQQPDRQWRIIDSKKNRRITVNTPATFSGPAANSPALHNTADNPTLGTVNNCGAGPTPWGTYVTCEENFNGYFGSNAPFTPTAEQARYGLNDNGFGYDWFKYDDRFDLTNPMYANEHNRFGWCVEIDPFNHKVAPVKRTALGRFKHESVAFMPEKFDERAVCYMGDDQRGDYCYKYVSDLPWREHLHHRQSPLDHGTLYVARFDEGKDGNDGMGSGEWLELSLNNPVLAEQFDSLDHILINARIAADLAGATPMDRPEWTTVGTQGEVFWTFTNNNRKNDDQGAVNEANPIFDNTDGHIIKTYDTSDTHFTWQLFMLARNTRRPDDVPEEDLEDLPFASYARPKDGGANVFTDPDAIWADSDGRVFIGTDGGQRDGLQNQLVVVDTQTGEYRRLLSGVAKDEITGITPTPDQRTLFTNTQHPGNGSPKHTNFPAPFDGVTIPRDCTLVITKKDGGKVGS